MLWNKLKGEHNENLSLLLFSIIFLYFYVQV